MTSPPGIGLRAEIMSELRQKYCYPGGGAGTGKEIRCAKSTVTVGGMDKTMSKTTRNEILQKLRRRYQTAGKAHKRKLLDQAQELLGYHRKSAIRALRAVASERGPVILTGRPIEYDSGLLVPWLRPIWQATDYACSGRLVAMLPEWIPAFEQSERRMPAEVREKLLQASARTLDRLLSPLRLAGTGRSLTRPGTLLRQQIPIRGSVWEEGQARCRSRQGRGCGPPCAARTRGGPCP